MPNVAVTVDSFDYTSKYPELAADKRPIWAIERGPGPIAHPPVQSQEVSPAGGGQTAYVNTWALGPLAAGQTRTFIWKVTPVKAGHAHRRTSPSPPAWPARREARHAAGRAGARHVHRRTSRPRRRHSHVNPNTGQVEVGAYPASTPAEERRGAPSGP